MRIPAARAHSFKYQYSTFALPPDTDSPSQAFNDFLELAPNLEAVIDPAENAGGTATARVKLTYLAGTDPAQRDKIDKQTWPCADVSGGTCAPLSASFTLPSPLNATVTDILGQERQYQLLLSPHDRRYHVHVLTEKDVPMIAAASGPLPATISATLDPLAETQALVTTFDYNEFGQITSLQGPEYNETNDWNTINGIIFGKVLKSSTAGFQSTTVTTKLNYVTAAREPVLDSVEKNGVLRTAQMPHRNRKITKRTETNPSDSETITTATRYDQSGIVTESRAYPASVPVPDNPPLPAGATRAEDRSVYAETGPQQARGRYHTVQSPGGMNIEMTYAADATGGEVETIVDSGPTPALTTKITRDSMDRVIEIETSGNAPDVHEKFGYDAGGRLLYHSRVQKNLGESAQKFTWDALGRQLSSSIDQANVAGAAGAEVKTSTDYDLSNRKITTTHPPNNAGVKAVTVASLDRLGRTVTVETTAPSSPTSKSVLGYDIHGLPAYQSDGALMAVLVQHDAVGRETGRVTTGGLQTTFQLSAWGEVTDERTKHFAVTVAHAQHLYAPQGTHVHTAWEMGAPIAGTGGTSLFRSTYKLWDSGGHQIFLLDGQASDANAPPGFIPGVVDVRESNAIHDVAGRVTESKIISSASTPTVLRQSNVTSFDGALPRTITEKAPLRDSATFTTTIGYDSLGSPQTIDAAGGYRTAIESDQLGNRLKFTPPGLQQETSSFDSRGLMITRVVPDPLGPKTIRYEYDALGGLTKMTDESGVPNVTLYDRDPLGRVTKVTYPDATFEQVEYEDQTGLTKATRDRAGQWLAYRYDSSGRVTEVHKGTDLNGPLILRYDYEPVGHHLQRVANVNAACEYDDYDLFGRPRITRSIRYAPGGNLADPATLVPTDVHVQQHVWSVFGMERARWRMPAAAAIPSSEPASQWRSWIDERRDGGGNLLKLTSTSAATGTSSSDFLILSATPAGVGELATRSRKAASGASIDSTYRYHDAAVALPAELAGGSALARQDDPSGALRALAVSRGTTPLAGTEVFRGASARVGAERALALGSRGSLYDYDGRRRLGTSKLQVSTTATATAGVTDVLTEADFRKNRNTVSAFSAAQHSQLGPAALTVEPPSWKASEKPAHQIDLRQLLLDGSVVADRQYVFAGGRRQTDAVWTNTYDEFGRLTQIESATRRIVATYDPLGRIVGRSAYYVDGGSWIAEDRQGVLDADGLPANVTFVWDAVSDRLVEIAEAGVSMQTAASPDAGLLRQYVHGDQAYDDPVEVLARDRTSSAVRRYLPSRDEVGTGSLEAVLDGATGDVVERVLYADAYGDAPRYLQGPVVDKITADVTKDASGTVEKIEFHVHLSEKLQAASVDSGVTVRAVTVDGFETGPPAGTASVDSADPFTATVKLTAAEWQSLQTAPNAASIRVAVTSQLRAQAWGETPVSPAPPWAVKLYGITTTALPFATRESVSTFAAFVSSAPPATKSDYPTIYSLPSLYLAGAEQSKTKLFTGFKAAPLWSRRAASRSSASAGMTRRLARLQRRIHSLITTVQISTPTAPAIPSTALTRMACAR